MNILSTPQTHMTVKGEMNSADAQGIFGAGGFGNQLSMDPEALKLLKDSGQLDNAAEFQKLLENAGEGVTPDELIAQLKQEGKKQKQLNTAVFGQENLNQNNSEQPNQTEGKEGNAALLAALKSHPVPGKEEVANKEIMANAQNPIKNSGAKAEGLLNGQKSQALTQNQLMAKNIALQGNMPQVANTQKSIFDVNKNAAKANLGNNIHPSQLNQMNQEGGKVLAMNAKQNVAKANPYKSNHKSMFNLNNMDAAKVSSEATPEVATSTSLQDVMFAQNEGNAGREFSQNLNSNGQQNKMNAMNVNNTAKVFDMNSLQNNTSGDEIIGKIQDYIIQSKASSQPEVAMSFKHNDLGQIDLLVQKAQNNHLNISIGARSLEGTRFFTQNQAELLATLNQSGIQIADFKLETSQSSNNQNLSQDSSKQEFGQNQSKQHQSESGQRQEESKKRQELWDFYQDKEVA